MDLNAPEARKVWDEYMEKVAVETDYGVEVLQDPKAMERRKELLQEMRTKLGDMGVAEFADDSTAVIECRASGEHMKMITPSGGYDVCFNCGAKQ